MNTQTMIETLKAREKQLVRKIEMALNI